MHLSKQAGIHAQSHSEHCWEHRQGWQRQSCPGCWDWRSRGRTVGNYCASPDVRLAWMWRLCPLFACTAVQQPRFDSCTTISNELSRVLLWAARPSAFLRVGVPLFCQYSFCLLQMHGQGVFVHRNVAGDNGFPRLYWARVMGLPAGHPQSRIKLGFISSPGGFNPFQWQPQIEMNQEMISLPSLLWIRVWKWIPSFYALKNSIWYHRGYIVQAALLMHFLLVLHHKLHVFFVVMLAIFRKLHGLSSSNALVSLQRIWQV